MHSGVRLMQGRHSAPTSMRWREIHRVPSTAKWEIPWPPRTRWAQFWWGRIRSPKSTQSGSRTCSRNTTSPTQAVTQKESALSSQTRDSRIRRMVTYWVLRMLLSRCRTDIICRRRYRRVITCIKHRVIVGIWRRIWIRGGKTTNYRT